MVTWPLQKQMASASLARPRHAGVSIEVVNKQEIACLCEGSFVEVTCLPSLFGQPHAGVWPVVSGQGKDLGGVACL